MTDEGEPVGPPHKLVDNEFSLFDVSDLVFIDPVSTGYSRTVPKEKPDQFHTVKKDIASVGEFIRIWTTRNQRWASPKFLIGESYGTTRAAGLAGYLQERHGMYLNGIMFVSSILNFITCPLHFSSPPTPRPPGTITSSRPTCRRTLKKRSLRRGTSPRRTTP
jgi:carboxypeptidase C (cathepsin A)